MVQIFTLNKGLSGHLFNSVGQSDRTWYLLISQHQDITASSFSISIFCLVWQPPLFPSLHMAFKHCQPKSVILCVGIQCASSLIQTISILSEAYWCQNLVGNQIKMHLFIPFPILLWRQESKTVLEFRYVYSW